jgi:hypothetical protein
MSEATPARGVTAVSAHARSGSLAHTSSFVPSNSTTSLPAATADGDGNAANRLPVKKRPSSVRRGDHGTSSNSTAQRRTLAATMTAGWER